MILSKFFACVYGGFCSFVSLFAADSRIMLQFRLELGTHSSILSLQWNTKWAKVQFGSNCVTFCRMANLFIHHDFGILIQCVYVVPLAGHQLLSNFFLSIQIHAILHDQILVSLFVCLFLHIFLSSFFVFIIHNNIIRYT